MELPVLRLAVEKGPRKGETLERRPGAVARIGRVVKGNHLALRDAGTSQKHLLFEFLREVSRWAVTDLDTSNGTFVNDGGPIPPSVPLPLSHGDVIKIGESTSISIQIVGEISEEEEKRKLGTAGKLQQQEDEGGQVGKKEVRRRGQRRAVPSLPLLPPTLEDSLVVKDADGVVALAPASRNFRRGKERPTKCDIVGEEASEESVVEKPKGRGRRPATKSASAMSAKEQDEMVGDALNSAQISDRHAGVALVKGRVRGGRRPATRSSAAKASKEEQELVEEPLASTALPDSKLLVASEEYASSKIEGSGRIQEAVVEKEMEIDMDKMTLGEWFDKMEKMLPLMISDASDQIIANLQEKARLFEEFVSTSSNGT